MSVQSRHVQHIERTLRYARNIRSLFSLNLFKSDSKFDPAELIESSLSCITGVTFPIWNYQDPACLHGAQETEHLAPASWRSNILSGTHRPPAGTRLLLNGSSGVHSLSPWLRLSPHSGASRLGLASRHLGLTDQFRSRPQVGHHLVPSPSPQRHLLHAYLPQFVALGTWTLITDRDYACLSSPHTPQARNGQAPNGIGKGLGDPIPVGIHYKVHRSAWVCDPQWGGSQVIVTHFLLISPCFLQ